MRLGAPDWFALSDRDLAACLYRRHFLAEGGRLTAAQAQIARGLGVSASVLPMCEQQVRTRVQTPRRLARAPGVPDRRRRRARGRGGGAAGDRSAAADRRGDRGAPRRRRDRDRALEPRDQHRADPRRPGDPRGDRDRRGARSSRSAPTSPARSSRARPSKFMRAVGRPTTAAGVATLYAGLLDAMVVDDGRSRRPPGGHRDAAGPTLMADASAAARSPESCSASPLAELSRREGTAVLPVKRFAAAKQRLGTGIADAQRPRPRRRDARRRPRSARAPPGWSSARSSSAPSRPRRRWPPRPMPRGRRGPRGSAATPRPRPAGSLRARRRGARLRRDPPRRLPAARPPEVDRLLTGFPPAT